MKFLGIAYEDRGPAMLFMDTNQYSNHIKVMIAGKFDDVDGFRGYLRGELAWIPVGESEGI